MVCGSMEFSPPDRRHGGQWKQGKSSEKVYNQLLCSKRVSSNGKCLATWAAITQAVSKGACVRRRHMARRPPMPAQKPRQEKQLLGCWFVCSLADSSRQFHHPAVWFLKTKVIGIELQSLPKTQQLTIRFPKLHCNRNVSINQPSEVTYFLTRCEISYLHNSLDLPVTNCQPCLKL